MRRNPRAWYIRIAALLLCCYLPLSWAGATPVIYHISKGEQQLDMLGSIHVGRADFYPMPAYVLTRFNQADRLVMEVHPSELASPAIQQQLQPYFMLSKPVPLSQRVSPKVYQQLQAALRDLGLPEAAFAPLRNWAIAMQVSMAEIVRLGLDQTLGVDHHFATLAQQHTMPIDGLETTEFQLGVLAQLDELNSDTLFSSTLDELAEADDYFKNMEAAWRTGNSKALNQLYAEYAAAYEQQAFMQQMTKERNQNWVAWLQQQDPSKRLFMVVGDMHLHGPDSILAMLKAQGYTITPHTAH